MITPKEIRASTLNRVARLVQEYAHLCNRTNTEVVHALLASKMLRRHGYTHEQAGHLTEDQGQAAIAVLDYWIEERTRRNDVE